MENGLDTLECPNHLVYKFSITLLTQKCAEAKIKEKTKNASSKNETFLIIMVKVTKSLIRKG